jgi:EAL domain-containing protein (putative c-di-GMP-specific phosphodiesterase class I)
MTAGSGDLFIGKRGKLSRSSGRKKSAPEQRAPGGSSKHAEEQAAQLREHREKLIRVTIANQTHQTVFQPIVDLNSGGAVGAEALARFAEPPIRPPNVWFAEAADLGLGVELEMAALRLALEQLRQLPPGLYLSLNASVETIMSEEFCASFKDVPAERVVLELTEHTEIHDYLLFEQTIEDLRSKGVRLAVDDAGAGYSSFRHILNLHPDVIKLDIALTRGIDGDPARRALGSALMTFGLDAYNASIVAEGIETEGEFKTLRALGCPFGQGYYLGRPGKLREAQPDPALAFAPAERLWRPEQATASHARPRQGNGVPSDPALSAQPEVSGSQPPAVAVAAVQPDPEPAGPIAQDTPNRDDHGEFMALVAEIQERQQDGDDRRHRRRSPMYTR